MTFEQALSLLVKLHTEDKADGTWAAITPGVPLDEIRRTCGLWEYAKAWMVLKEAVYILESRSDFELH